MLQTAAHLVDHAIPHVSVRQWVLSLPIALRLLLAAQPELVTTVLQVVQRVLTRHLLDRADEHAAAARPAVGAPLERETPLLSCQRFAYDFGVLSGDANERLCCTRW